METFKIQNIYLNFTIRKVFHLITTIVRPYPDEIFYSWFGRSHLLSGNIYSSQTDLDFFHIKKHKKCIHYPSNLDYFCSLLPSSFNISTDTIIINNTCFPFFRPFLKTCFSDYITEIMKYGMTTPIDKAKKIGNLFNGKVVKLCKQCIHEDKKRYGEAYIHRLHQIPGCFICPHHYIPLEYINLLNTKFETNYFLLDNIINSGTPFRIDNKIYSDLVKLQSEIIYFLKFDTDDYTINKVISKYKQKLKIEGYSTLKGVIKYEKLINDFQSFYPQDLLDFLNCNINTDTVHNWLCTIMRNVKTKLDPIKHFLFIIFLFKGIENFINAPEELLPFGSGPWPCLNIASNHYKEDRIPSYKLKESTYNHKIYGIFECKCGFSYARVLSVPYMNDKYNKSYVINWGEDWEKKATNLIISENYNISELSSILDCSSGKIISYATKNNLLHHINTKRKRIIVKDRFKNNKNLLEEYKQKIEQFICDHKYMSRSEIWNALPQECKTIWKNDKEWYDSTLPPKLIIASNKQTRVDWEKKDMEVYNLVERSIREIQENTCLRLTKKNISEKVGVSLRDLYKMPITQMIIENSYETREEYLKRKIDYIVKNSFNKGDFLTPKQIVSKFHFSNKMSQILYGYAEESAKKYSLTNKTSD
jgi:hypothetical protein